MIYEWKCPDCNVNWTEMRPVEDCYKPSYCKCGVEGRKVLQMVSAIFQCGGFPGESVKADKRGMEMKSKNLKTMKGAKRMYATDNRGIQEAYDHGEIG